MFSFLFFVSCAFWDGGARLFCVDGDNDNRLTKALSARSPIEGKEEVFKRVKTALDKKFGIETEGLDLKSMEFDYDGFSTIAGFRINGVEKLAWAKQRLGRAVRIKHLGDIQSMLLWNYYGVIYWRDFNGKHHLRRAPYKGADRQITQFYPENVPVELVTVWQKDKNLEVKAKKPGSDAFEYWEYNVGEESWKRLSEDKREYSIDDHIKHIKAQYPKIGTYLHGFHNEKFFLISLRDPQNIMVEKLVTLTRNPGMSTYTENKPLVVQADSIRTSGVCVQYRKTDGWLHTKKLVVLQNARGEQCLVLKNALPSHPSILNWDEVEFSGDGKFIFAQSITNHGRNAKYWTTKDGVWYLLHKGMFLEKVLKGPTWCARANLPEIGITYRYHYHDLGLTLECLNASTLQFGPTNVTNFPVSIVMDIKTVYSKKPGIILAVENYKDGVTGWTFCPEADSTRQQYENLKEKLRKKWRDENRLFADAPFSVCNLSLYDNDQLDGLNFLFYQSKALKGKARLFGKELFVEWDKPVENAVFPLHPLLQPNSADVNGHEVPYYYVPPVGAPNAQSLVLIDGGPCLHYKGGYADIVDHYTKNGWSVIIPQESLRTGYGWKHFSKGLGEMGRGNLHQLLHVFYDAQAKGLVPDINKVSLYGASYGGFVGLSFALRWQELHKEAGLEEKFHLKSIVADAAWVDGNLHLPKFLRSLLPDDKLGSVDEYIRHVMPIHRTDMQLSTLLSLVHGMVDVRCSAAHIKKFIEKLRSNGKDVPLFWHQGGHNQPEHKRYPEFLMALMNETTTSGLVAEIGLTLG